MSYSTYIHQHFKRALLCLTIIISAITNSAVWALDTQAAIEIESDTAVIEEDSRSHTYTGEVVLKQDNLLLRADKLMITFNDKQQVMELTVYGKNDAIRAYLQQTFEQENTQAEAWAHIIKYSLSDKNITMTGDVLLIKGNNQFKGEAFVYDLDNESIIANAQHQEGDRVQMIIQP